MSNTLGGRIGLVCNREHDVFSAVATRLRLRGAAVEFVEPGRELAPAEIERFDLLANKKVDPASLRALHYADTHGLSTWNGFLTALLGNRPIGYAALRAVGFEVPEFTFEKPAYDHVAKTMFDWHYHPDPVRGGDGDVYQRYVPAEPIDYKYYGVDDGTRRRVRVLRSTSKLHGEKEYLDTVPADPDLAAQVRRLMALVDAHAIGVDVVDVDGAPYAVDVNPAMSFRHADMEGALADSMSAALEHGALAPSRKSFDGVVVDFAD
jgi:hypothetical protein